MSNEQFNRAFAPTVPDDLKDPPLFGQLHETVKDALVLELRHFFLSSQVSSSLRSELPTIEKYANFGDSNDPYSTSVNIIRKFPEKLEKLPHIAVMTSSSQEKKLTIGSPYISTVQDPSTITAANAEPYALNDGDILVLRTLPDGRTVFLDSITFTADRFPTGHPISAALSVDVARVVNEQARSVFATVTTVSNVNYVTISCGGLDETYGGSTPTELEVSSGSVHADVVLGLGRGSTALTIGGTAPNMTLTKASPTWSSADIGRYVNVFGSQNPFYNDGRFLVTAFSTSAGTDTLTYTNPNGRTEGSTTASWYIGLRDNWKNPAHPPKHRYGMAADMSCQIDILTEDENTRGEVVDLVVSFFSFFLENKYFTFLGRSDFTGQTATGEYYQIVINPPMAANADTEVARPGDGVGKIYINSLTVNLTVSMYLDRIVYRPGTTTPFIVDSTNLVYDPTLPVPPVQ